MHESSSVLKFIDFADDTAVFAAGSDLSEVSRLINKELINVDNWLKINRLSLNLKKDVLQDNNKSKYSWCKNRLYEMQKNKTNKYSKISFFYIYTDMGTEQRFLL